MNGLRNTNPNYSDAYKNWLPMENGILWAGWYLQPDCTMLSGESFIRQIEYGRRYFKEKFDKTPTTAINFDPFGHTRGLVQILKRNGFDSYLFMRPGMNRGNFVMC